MAGDQRHGGRGVLKQYHRIKVRLPGHGHDGEIVMDGKPLVYVQNIKIGMHRRGLTEIGITLLAEVDFEA